MAGIRADKVKVETAEKAAKAKGVPCMPPSPCSFVNVLHFADGAGLVLSAVLKARASADLDVLHELEFL